MGAPRGPCLVADIGGTRARFALVHEPGARPASFRAYAVADLPGPEEAIRRYLEEAGHPGVTAGALAVATAVSGDRVRFTNSPWAFSKEALRGALGWERLSVLNDFAALALALPLLGTEDLRRVGGGDAVADAPVALIGPGTGLGVSGLVRCGGDWTPIAGEGGHAAFSPATRREKDVLEHLWSRWERVSWERLLSGPGLVTLHRALAAVDGVSCPELAPAAITARALAGSDPRCAEVLDLFCGMLGTAAANLCLTLGARGGVFIGGGIVPALGERFAASPFRARFELAGRFTDYVAAVPTWVVTAPDAGLRGAAHALTVAKPSWSRDRSAADAAKTGAGACARIRATPTEGDFQMPIRVAINGYGRIGRNILRALYESGRNGEIQIVAINDLGSAETNAHLTRYDTAHGKFNGTVSVEGDAMLVNGESIKVFAERDPAKLPWKAMDVDVVMECTGIFTSKDKAAAHLAGGARKVIISAPGKNVDATVVYGVNHHTLKASHTVISNASCTTNCLAPLVKPLHDRIGVVCGLMTTIHAYTNDQVLTDVYHEDLRRARAATMSMIPTKTGAAAAVGLVLPELNGKLDGYAIRVPTINVSIVDLSFVARRPTSAEEINAIMKEAASGELKGILGYNQDPLVSVDFNHDPRSSIFDATLTKVSEGTLVKVSSWYDNEWGFSNRMLDTAVAFVNAK